MMPIVGSSVVVRAVPRGHVQEEKRYGLGLRGQGKPRIPVLPLLLCSKARV